MGGGWPPLSPDERPRRRMVPFTVLLYRFTKIFTSFARFSLAPPPDDGLTPEEAILMSTILADWQPHYASLFGEHILNLKHRLHESPLFSDAALARLIENTPPEHCYVNTMDKRAHNPRSRREGAIAGLSGEAALAAIRS